MSATAELLRELIHSTAPLDEYLRQPTHRLLFATCGSLGGFTDVIILIDAADFWQDLLLPAIATARTASARLLVLVSPSQDGSRRLDAVRSELQCHDIRTLPSGILCVELPDPAQESLAEFLQQAPQPLVFLRSGAVAMTLAATELLPQTGTAATAEPRSGSAWQLLDCTTDPHGREDRSSH